MVNWREDFEFCYVLAMLVAGVVTFFSLYNWTGMVFAGAADIVLIVCMALSGYVAFETDWALGRWEKFDQIIKGSKAAQ